jgi:hypothetical protein
VRRAGRTFEYSHPVVNVSSKAAMACRWFGEPIETNLPGRPSCAGQAVSKFRH